MGILGDLLDRLLGGNEDDEKTKEEKGLDILDKAVGKGAAPAIPYEVVKEHLKKVKDAYEDASEALEEVAKAIETGEDPDKKKIKKGGEVDKKVKEGVEKGAEAAGKSILDGIIDWLKGLLGL